MKFKLIAIFGSFFALLFLAFTFLFYRHGVYFAGSPADLASQLNQLPVVADEVESPFVFHFEDRKTVEETRNMDRSSSAYWWVNSGGRLNIAGGMGSTVQGKLPASSRWRLAYSLQNPTDTDNGYHPQNIFRLVSRSKWKDFEQSAYFMITWDNLSKSRNRNESNGLFLFSRYLDGDNLYYVGLRVDGTAVIKKKVKGTYHTLAQAAIFPGSYERDKKPNLLPHKRWIGVKSGLKTNADDTVSIKMYLDVGKTGEWTPVLEAVDDGARGGKPILKEGHAGIRTDFMDVRFDDWTAKNI